MKKILSFDFFAFIFCILISIPVILPYFHQGYFPTHDGEWAVVRLSDMYKELRDFQFPPRFSGNLNFGYGYPLFNFTYPMPYYLGSLLHLLKFGFVDSIKIIFALTVPLSAFFMYLASKEIWKNKKWSLLSSVFYVFLPYRMVDLYVRGSIGESLAFVLFPLILYISTKLSKEANPFWIFGGSLAFATLVLSHNIMAVLFSLFLLFYILFLKVTDKNLKLKPIITFISFGLLISSFFWFPALMEKNNILLSQIPIADRNLYWVSLEKFIMPSWGYEVPTDQVRGFTYQLGWPHLVAFISVFFLIILRFLSKSKFKQIDKTALGLILIVFFLSLLLFPISKLVWSLPILSEINYPWTMLLPVGFLVSLTIPYLSTSNFKYLALLLSFLAIYLVLPYAKPEYYVDRGEGFYSTNDATTTSSSELMPLWVKEKPLEMPKQKVESLDGRTKINNIQFNSKKVSFEANSTNNSISRVNTIYYPGWRAYSNSKELQIDYSNNKGVMDLKVPEGHSKIELLLSETPMRLASDIVSLISLFVLSIFFGRQFIKKTS